MPASNDANRPWYYQTGIDSDVAVSTRVRLARNMPDFVFPRFLTNDDASRIQSMVYDALSCYDGQSFRLTPASSLNPAMRSLLAECGIISPEDAADPRCGVIINDDGQYVCALNTTDHVRIASFVSGFDIQSAYQSSAAIDAFLQERIQFASDGEFGYLTAALKDTGSGLKTSVILHLPSLSVAGTLDRVIRDVIAGGFSVNGFYSTKDSSSLGSFFLISTAASGKGSAEEQLSVFSAAVSTIIDAERKARTQLQSMQPTLLEDMAYRALAIAQNARFISLRESIEIISRVQLGIHAGILHGNKNDRLYSLLYTVKNAHVLMRLSDDGEELRQRITFDVQTDDQKLDRMRALLIQHSINSIKGNV